MSACASGGSWRVMSTRGMVVSWAVVNLLVDRLVRRSVDGCVASIRRFDTFEGTPEANTSAPSAHRISRTILQLTYGQLVRSILTHLAFSLFLILAASLPPLVLQLGTLREPLLYGRRVVISTSSKHHGQGLVALDL